MSNDKRVTAIFDSRPKAEAALTRLETLGYRKEDMTILVAENAWNKSSDIKITENTKGAEGAAIGAGVGGIIGAVVGGLTAVGTVAATGGVGLLAAGPLVAALAGAGAAGSTGGIVGGLVGLGFPEVEAKYVDEKLGRGSVMIGVETDSDRASALQDALKQMNPEKVTTH